MSVEQLGYVGFEVSNLAAWEKLATKVLGMGVSRRFDDGGLALRLDGQQQRLLLTPGAADDLTLLGFQVASQGQLTALANRLLGAGVAVTPLSAPECRNRAVQAAVRFVEPGGVTAEAYVGPKSDEPYVSPLYRSGYVADELGFGHVALRANDMAASERFFCDVLGFKLSDRIICRLGEVDVNITFLHVGPRHHSLALGVGLPKHIHHFMLQVNSVDDVGLAMDLTAAYGFKIVQTMGRHPNDKMITFYGETPSGFQFEFGAGGLSIDDATWQSQTHHIVSEWGHKPPKFYARDR